MVELVKLDTNAPLIAEDLTLGVLSCTINVEGAIKTYYFQHVKGGLIVNDELAMILRNAFEKANILEGNNGISTHIDSFIPSEVMDSSLIGIRQVGIDYIDNTKSTITIEKIAMKTKLPQALLFYMLDSVLSEYREDSNMLSFEISSDVISEAKLNGYYHHLQKFIDSRELKENIVDGELLGYIHQDLIAMKLAKLQKEANVVEGRVADLKRRLYLEQLSDRKETQFSNNMYPFLRKVENKEENIEVVNTSFRRKIR